MVHHSVEHSVVRAIRRSFRGETVVVAVSGGPDSMAMLHALCMHTREHDVRVVAAHFDHRLRSDSHVDRDLVAGVAGELGVRFVTAGGDVISRARETGSGVEAAGRELRYQFLNSVADEMSADSIVTAHTRSDQIETVLMRILRGAGARGLRGIHARRGRIVRPLLAVPRAETLAYCESYGVAYVTDPSNTDRRYARNRVRHDVLPSLRLVYPGIDDALLRIARAAELEFERAGEAVGQRARQFLRREATGWLLDVEAFTDLDREDCLHLVSAVLEAMDARTDVSALHHAMLFDLVAADNGAMCDVPGLRVRREHDGLFFVPPAEDVDYTGPGRMLTVPGELYFDSWHFEARETVAPDRISADGGVAYLSTEGPLRIRRPSDGDRIRPFGMKGRKKLSDLFIDRKIPQRLRATTPVVECDGEILWVVGVAVSESTRVQRGTGHVVQLTASRTEPQT